MRQFADQPPGAGCCRGPHRQEPRGRAPMITATGPITRAALQAEIAAITALMMAQERVQTAAAETIEHLSVLRRELRELLEEDRR